MPSTRMLLLRRYMNCASTEDYIDWAVERLTEGVDTPNLRILAGLLPIPEGHQVETYFLKTSEELGLQLLSGDSPARMTASSVRDAFEGGEISPEETVEFMADLYSDYSDPVLGIWYEIKEELSLRGSGHEGCFYQPVLLDNLEQVVSQEMQLFSRAVSLDLPRDFTRYIQCDRCSTVGLPRSRTRSVLDFVRSKLSRNRAARDRWASCGQCGSFDYRTMSEPEVRESYFRSLEA